MASLDDLLEKTSRTFALSIPVLPEPTRREVMIAYLLFRIADTFEDASHWDPDARIAALSDFRDLLSHFAHGDAERLARDWVARRVAHHAGYQELMAETPFVLDAFFALSPGAIEPIRVHVTRSADGMASIVARTRDGRLTLQSVRDRMMTNKIATIQLKPGRYMLMTTAFSFEFIVNLDGKLDYHKSLDKCLEGRGATTLVVKCSFNQQNLQ